MTTLPVTGRVSQVSASVRSRDRDYTRGSGASRSGRSRGRLPHGDGLRSHAELPLGEPVRLDIERVVEARAVVLHRDRGDQLHDLLLVEARAQALEELVRHLDGRATHAVPELDHVALLVGERVAVAVADELHQLLVGNAD